MQKAEDAAAAKVPPDPMASHGINLGCKHRLQLHYIPYTVNLRARCVCRLGWGHLSAAANALTPGGL